MGARFTTNKGRPQEAQWVIIVTRKLLSNLTASIELRFGISGMYQEGRKQNPTRPDIL